MYGSLFERWSDKALIGDDCWEWGGYRGAWGYGAVRDGRRSRLAHRVSYELFVGEIAQGMCVLHHCDNPGCVKPGHLFIGSHQDNADDKVAKGRQAHTRGAACGNAKLSEDDVRAIRAASGPYRELQERFGVCNATISYVKTGYTWRDVPQDARL